MSSGLLRGAAAGPSHLGAVLVNIALVVSLGVLIYIYVTGRQRSTRWRARMLAEHGQEGYLRRRRAWRIGAWGFGVAMLCGSVVLQMVGH